MPASFQQLRETIPLYLNGSLGEQQAKQFLEEIKAFPELQQELDEFSTINEAFDKFDIPDEAQFDSLFTQVEARIVQEHVDQKIHAVHPQHQDAGWLEKFRELFVNPFVPWGIAVAQFAIVALLLLQTPSQDSDIRYQSLTQGTAQHTTTINVVFMESATLAEMNALLLQHQLEIVSGPGRGKVFSLSVADSAQLDPVIEKLRQSGIVRFAQKTGAE